MFYFPFPSSLLVFVRFVFILFLIFFPERGPALLCKIICIYAGKNIITVQFSFY